MTHNIGMTLLLLCLVLFPLYSAIPTHKIKRDAEEEPGSSDKTEGPKAEDSKTEEPETEAPKTDENKDATTKKPSGGIFDDLTAGVQSIADNFGQSFNGKGSPNFLNNASSWFSKLPVFG